MCCFNGISKVALPRVWVWIGWPPEIPSNLNDSVVGCKVGWYKTHKTWQYYLLVRYSFLKQFIWPKAFAKIIKEQATRSLNCFGNLLSTCLFLAIFLLCARCAYCISSEICAGCTSSHAHQQRDPMSSATGSSLLLLSCWWMAAGKV